MRPLADEDPVAPDGVDRMRHRRADVLLVASMGNAGHAELLVGEQVADEVDRTAPASAAASATLSPMKRRFSSSRAPLITTIDQSIGISWKPSQPSSSISTRSRSRSAGSRRRSIVAAEPPTWIQLGRNAWR